MTRLHVNVAREADAWARAAPGGLVHGLRQRARMFPLPPYSHRPPHPLPGVFTHIGGRDTFSGNPPLCRASWPPGGPVASSGQPALTSRAGPTAPRTCSQCAQDLAAVSDASHSSTHSPTDDTCPVPPAGCRDPTAHPMGGNSCPRGSRFPIGRGRQ